jgi:hypothetical protein
LDLVYATAKFLLTVALDIITGLSGDSALSGIMLSDVSISGIYSWRGRNSLFLLSLLD